MIFLHRFNGVLLKNDNTESVSLCPVFPPRSRTFVEEFLEAVGALAQDGPDLLLLEGTSSDLQGFGQRYVHLLCQSRGKKTGTD